MLIVREKSAMPEIAKVFAATPVAVWRDYLTVHYLHNMSDYLPKAFDDADFDFYGKVLGGQSQELPRATRGVRLLDQRLGHPLGKLYVAKYFPPESKAKVEALVANLLKAYDADIRKITWMSDAPSRRRWRSSTSSHPMSAIRTSGATIPASSSSATTSSAISSAAASSNIATPARPHRPAGRPQRMGHDAADNQCLLHLGIQRDLLPGRDPAAPFFDPNADDAVNYGGIGVVMGHEIGHGFDDQGSKYTGLGVLESWWTDEDRKNFEARTSALGAQFDSYEELPGLHVQGKLTMGENIGDLSGLTIARRRIITR